MNANLQKLLDNGWMITILRNVAREYSVIVTKRHQSVYSVMPEFGTELVDGEPRLIKTDDGIPRQRADGKTVDEAFEKLVENLFCRS